jgi:hypothetical protein
MREIAKYELDSGKRSLEARIMQVKLNEISEETQPRSVPMLTADDLALVTMTIKPVTRKPVTKESATRTPDVEEALSAIEEHLREIGLFTRE